MYVLIEKVSLVSAKLKNIFLACALFILFPFVFMIEKNV